MEINENIENNHFDLFQEYLNSMDSVFFKDKDEILDKCNYLSVKAYNKKINYDSGMTEHFKSQRFLREDILRSLIGIGFPIKAFLVNLENKLQIHEILNNGIINIYDFETHKKITMFAPHPDRLNSLYESTGQTPPEYLIIKSKENLCKGYNLIHIEH